MEVNIHQAKTHLSRLIEQMLSGEDIIIAKAGKPVARLMPIEVRKPILGSGRGDFELKPGWDDPLTDQEFDELFGQDVYPPEASIS